MKFKIIKTEDGSDTLFSEQFKESFHSKYGAISESMHVFIKNGLQYYEGTDHQTEILEIGFGTGLNALLSSLEAITQQRQISYTAIDPDPLPEKVYCILNYPSFLKGSSVQFFDKIHRFEWDKTVRINPFFTLLKKKNHLANVCLNQNFYNIIYYDAFSPEVQPEMWTRKVFDHLFSCLKNGGLLVTYTAKGMVRRAMTESGFVVQRIEGPPGKREIMRAVKPFVKLSHNIKR